MNELWQAVLGEVEVNVSRGNYNAWFKNTELIDSQDGHVVIAVPNVFTKQQMEVKFTGQILEIFNKIGEPVKQITYTIKSVGKKKTGNNIKIAEQPPVAQVVTSPKTSANSSGLNPKLVFETFVVGSSNELAYTACQTISKSPGTKYNPLFLYGGVGLGKTHLIQAVGNAIHQKKPNSRILYISTETFVSEFVDSLRFKRPGFSDRYRSVDVLIVDDIQFIAGKEKTQEEFFHTFNVLHQTDKQIIVSSDKPPKSIPTLEDRLRSRLEWGMAIDIQTPDFETRCAILQNKASQSGVTLERETAEYLSAHIQTNIRELEGALNQLLAFCEMRGTSPDLQTASGLLGNVRATRPHHITIKQVIEKTARHFQVELIDILSPKRDKYIALPRQVAMYLLRSELHLSFPKIANELGRKDHTTAIHSVDKIEKAIKLDYIIRQQVSEIREKLYV
ncbi:MAG TPA: chromosomal replication initiator protein DnaA [Patescibacteria group bacterium]|jgi:chromosomal replication initiator protein|nr:chromosomal replication initiator protein DnaA [Patescibacteria group bacterium]